MTMKIIIKERKLTPAELKRREEIIKDMKKNKRSLVKKYGKEAEKVMYGRSTNLVKKQSKEEMDRLKEIIEDSLLLKEKEFSSSLDVIEFFKNEDRDPHTINVVPKNYPEARSRAEAKGYKLSREIWEEALKKSLIKEMANQIVKKLKK